jgi:Fe-S oxidoreductase
VSTVARLEADSGQNVWACYQCGKCTADCPFGLNPHEVVRLLQLGDVEGARALSTPWECASCLTCEAACPKGVSPARLNRALRRTGKPPGAIKRLRAYALASAPRTFALAAAAAPLSNWASRVPGARLIGHHVMGIHRERAVPTFVRPTFPEWFRRRAPGGDGRRGRVLLFHDTFTDYCHPQVGVATTELLEAAGFRVELTDTRCCGRPLISKGFDRQAASCARVNVDRLYEAAAAGTWIVGCEPSCLLSLRDEYPDLVPEMREKAEVVASRARLVDEFLADLAGAGQLELRFRDDGTGRTVLVHGHCHQKALSSPDPTLALLELAGYRPELVNSGCCGMAGTYGYDTAHFDLSREAGERALFPAIRSRPDAEVCISGVSCRSQIEQFTGRPVRHLVELVREAMVTA